MNIVIANGPGRLDNGQEVILFPSRWDSGIPNGKKPFAFYPYELCLLSALLKRELPQHNIKFLDGNLEGWDGDRYIQEIAKLEPDVLICECSALTYPTMTRVMQGVKRLDDKDGTFQAVLCGPMANDAQTRRTGVSDGWGPIITGEYELKVLEYLDVTVPPEARTDAGLISLDWLPWPEDEDVDRTRYREINHYIDYATDDAIVDLYATRGCPLSCTFCVVPTYYGGHGKTSRSHRCRDVQDVCDEIEYLAAKYPNFKGCYFNEEAHSANPEWLASFCEALIKRGLNNYNYDAMCGMWTFTPELVQLCAAAGYKQIRFGMESTSENVGKAIKKTIHKDKTEQFLRWLKEAGIGAYCTIMVGAMGSTEASDLATIRDVKEWIKRGMIQKWQLSTSTPQPGTPFWDLAKKNGWLLTENPEHLDGYRACVSFPEYPANRIQIVRDGAGL
jgi:anaerobic magnesium-protoporphyrin IX monomethyl ester cyclase